MARRKIKRAATQLAFDALSIEGGLLSPEWLSKVAQLGAGQQTEPEYRIPRGLNLRDEIGRYWRIAQAHWADFAAARGNADAGAVARRFVVALLRDGFGFSTLTSVSAVTLAERSYPIGHAALGTRVPVVVAPAGAGIDTLAPEFGDENRRRSAFGLVQEHLNADEGALWGLVSDGVTLRIARDNASLTRPAWIEADLARIFTEQRFADFAALWLLAHETRFGETDQPVTECALERWREAGRAQGTVARERLRFGVEDALLALGQGFLAHPANQKLRADLQSGALSTKDYFNQLLRLVYRLIFVLTVEERGLLHPDGTDEKSALLYADGYSMRRLRERAVRRSAHDRFADLWESTTIVFGSLAAGEPRLGLPALAGIFAKSQCPALDASKLENRHLSLAMFKLSWIRDDASLSRVNWRDMGPEELGSVYESLLELVPQITKDGRQFAFATGGETKGNARKTTGSYYTPDSLVQVLLDSALEPVVAETIAKNPEKPAEALLRLSIVDPACGSGHFLLAAARRLAAHVARLEANGTPSAREYRHALRQVIGHCIYGVDLNPMAVELCKVSLWMEAVEPGLPLTFLNSHIQHGNALLGTTPDLMANGIPDAAWVAIESDDKKITSALKKKNKAAASGQRGLALGGVDPAAERESVARAVTELEAAPDADVVALANKESRWDGILDSEEYRHQKLVADAWCAAFVWPKQTSALADAAPTNELWRQLRDGQSVPPLTIQTTAELADQYRFFHWHLRFPQVFARGGFNVVLGNPPWERVKIQEQEFFASRSEGIASAPNAAARKRLIALLREDDPSLWAEWSAASRRAEGESQVIRASGRYPLCGRGDVNTYAIFAEHNRSVLGSHGRAGFIVPTGIATDDTTKEYFGTLVAGRELSSLYGFENEEFVFPGVHHAFRFALLTIARNGDVAADLVFFARQVAALGDRARHVSLSPANFATLNPNTRTCPTFRSRRDAEINLAMYQRAGILWREDDEAAGNAWSLKVRTRLWHMAEDSEWFRSRSDLEAEGNRLEGSRFVGSDTEYAPLIEAKMVHQFDHRFGTYEGQSAAQENQGKLPELDDTAHADPFRVTLPYYWVAEREVADRLREFWPRDWLLGWRDICRSSDQRTLIPAVVPRAATGDTFMLALPLAMPSLSGALYANLCAYVLDYAARQKVGGTHLKLHTLKQLPVLSPATYSRDAPWDSATSLGDWILPRVLELTYTAWDLEPFARDLGYNGPPFRWRPERRFLLRCELDAAFFQLYGLSRDDTAYVMDTFPVVRRNDEKAHGGRYRTRDTVLAIFDEMADAAREGEAYATRLQPAPAAADPRIVHEPRMPPVPATRPTFDPAEDVARFVWAAMHRRGGSIERSALAYAYSLRRQPDLLRQLAPPALAGSAASWSRLAAPGPEAGALTPVLQQLEQQGAARFAARGGASVVTLGPHSPQEAELGEWHRAEAALLLGVLAHASPTDAAKVDATLAEEDRRWMHAGTAA